MAEKKGNIGKNILFGILLIGLCFPLIQQLTKFAYVRELKGDVEVAQEAKLTSANWFSGKYQDSTSKYINDNFGFRNDFIRINNERHYLMYNQAKANGVVIGKESYLYELGYIKAAMGLDFVGLDSVKINVDKLKYVSDTLQALGKEIIVVFAPGKGSYFPEFITDVWTKQKKKQTNVKAYTSECKSRGINYIDLNSWFINAKDTTTYPLYGKGGIHWSKYGEYIVMDTMLNYLENHLKVDLPNLVLREINMDSNNKWGDNDIEEGMNLYSRMPSYPMAYPDYHFDKENRAKYDSVTSIVVGDSYYWGLFNKNLSSDCFVNGEFWYYNELVYSIETNGLPQQRAEIDLLKKVEANDLIIILSTDANLDDFGFGVIEELYKAYQ